MTRDVHVVLASAGSGKTWRLTTHLLQLVCSGVPAERILASTFTRKAAAEILARVFARLAAAAGDERARDELNAAVGATRTCEEYRELLAKTARNVQRFRVRTLDAFFVELARAFAGELGFTPGWSIADDVTTRRARAEAVTSALERGRPEQWSVLLRELDRGANGRGVHETLMAVVADGHALASESAPAAWNRLRPPPELEDGALRELTWQLAEFPVPLTVKGQPHATWHKGLARARACVAEERWTELFEAGIGAKLLAHEHEYSGREIAADLVAILDAFAAHAAAVAGGELQRQNVATRALLERFDVEYRRGQRERGELRFEDLPLALAARDEHGWRARLDDVALRLDARIDHLLLDEFQDTSPAQWRVLAPFADELAADGGGGRSFFCVGDSKQSIYGWRAAEPRLLEELPARLHVAPERLHVSWRSAQVVLDAVNAVFGGLAGNAVFDGHAEDRPAAAEIEAAFQRHEAHDTTLTGSVRIHTSAGGLNADQRRRSAVATVAALVAEIRAAAPSASIAVLLRRRRIAGAIVRKLRDADIAASDEGGNTLCDSAAVQVALSLLHSLEHPGDLAASFHVRTSKLAHALGLPAEPSAKDVQALRERERAAFLDRGLAQRLAELRPAVEEQYGTWEARRFGQLIEFALAWRAPSDLRLRDFVERVRAQSVEDPSGAQVKVMTIHAAKGLEFDAVVVPDLDFRFVARGATFVWARRGGDPTQDIDAVSRAGGATLTELLTRAGDPTLAQLAAATRQRALRDELSALYVAMTRARHRLDLVIAPEGSQQPASSAAGLLREAFGLTCGPLTPSSVELTAEGSDDAWTAQRPERPATQALPARAIALHFRAPARPREMERVSPSRLETRGRKPLAELFRAVDAPWLGRGQRLHGWLERVEWLEAFTASDAQLRAQAVARGLGGAGLDEDLAELRRQLDRPTLKALLARASYAAPTAEVWRERRFRQVVGSGVHAQLVSGAFDRVVVERDGARVLRADLIDFKSGRVGGDEARISALAEHYAPQLRAYREALERITGLETGAIRARLVFIEAERVLEL